MNASNVSLLRNDGLHIHTRATLQQVAQDQTTRQFADGLLVDALGHVPPSMQSLTLGHALAQAAPAFYPFLTALLTLDAEVDTVAAEEKRVFPLPGYLSYRHRLPPDRFPLNLLRLPPLNPGGRYRMRVSQTGECTAARLDIHPTLKVVGHVRIAVSSAARPPMRLYAAEHRLDRQPLSETMIELSLVAGSDAAAPPLTAVEYNLLHTLLHNLYRHN